MHSTFSKLNTLDKLLIAMKLKDHRVMDKIHPDQFSTILPTFGGNEPRKTEGIWSWDENSVIVGSCAYDLEIVDREDVV